MMLSPILAGLLAVSAQAFTHCKGVAYIAFAKDGTVSVNGAPTDLSLLNETVARTTSKFVFYYREGSESDPPDLARARDVMDAVMKLRRPISMSSRPDFSDVVDGDGRSQPRTACPEQG